MPKIVFSINTETGETTLTQEDMGTACGAVHVQISGDLARALSMPEVEVRNTDPGKARDVRLQQGQSQQRQRRA